VRVGERDVALHLGTDRLRVVVVEDQAVDVAGRYSTLPATRVSGERSLRPSALMSTPPWFTRALVAAVGSRRRCGPHAAAFFNAAVEQGIPAHGQVVEPGPL
jgi:hypothetical protein